MSTLLLPGRHLVNTRTEYLRAILGKPPELVSGTKRGAILPTNPIDRVAFAATPSNQENSRYNFHLRADGAGPSQR